MSLIVGHPSVVADRRPLMRARRRYPGGDPVGSSGHCMASTEPRCAQEGRDLVAVAAEGRRFHPELPDDLLELEDFNDSELLQALWQRYERLEIYTWVGSVLVSVNPYSDIGAFKQELMARYASAAPPPAPHLYASVRAALAAPGDRHAVLITGESGAGKTEATRAILSFLALRGTLTPQIRDRLLQSTPVVEAFGNAHTRQNTNSSRFGKFIEVYLSSRDEVIGAGLKPYMLESSRVSGALPEGEFTYHIFYLLRAAVGFLPGARLPPQSGDFWSGLAQTPEWVELARLGLPLVASTRLEGGPSEELCLQRFVALHEGLRASGVSHSDIAECCRLVAAVGLLADEDASLTSASLLLRIDESVLRTFFCQVEVSIGADSHQENFCRTRGFREAATLRASFAQELYSAIFGWLTRLVAHGIRPPALALSQVGVKMLGLLDLYGFEVFASNGFEQFLINYCNERLQQLFNRQVFIREADEYAQEGLDSEGQWSSIKLACQLPALGLLEGDGPRSLGMFAIIDDRSRCSFEEGNTSTQLAEAISKQCGSHMAFRRANRDPDRIFGVAHFAGDVFYEAAQFAHKNASAHRPDIVAFLRENGGTFVRDVFDGEVDEAIGAGHSSGATWQRRRLFGRTTISTFQQELNELCTSLEARQCRHVRCLRPNDEQEPLVFDNESMLRQCRYSGLLEATRIRRQGYAHRRPLLSFLARFAAVLPQREARRDARLAPMAAAAAACLTICDLVPGAVASKDDIRVGHTKVFLRAGALEWLEGRRIQTAIVMIVSLMQQRCEQQRYKRLRSAAIMVQHRLRERVALRKAWAIAVARAAVRLQRFWRHKASELRCLRAMRAAMEAVAKRQSEDNSTLPSTSISQAALGDISQISRIGLSSEEINDMKTDVAARFLNRAASLSGTSVSSGSVRVVESHLDSLNGSEEGSVGGSTQTMLPDGCDRRERNYSFASTTVLTTEGLASSRWTLVPTVHTIPLPATTQTIRSYDLCFDSIRMGQTSRVPPAPLAVEGVRTTPVLGNHPPPRPPGISGMPLPVCADERRTLPPRFVYQAPPGLSNYRSTMRRCCSARSVVPQLVQADACRRVASPIVLYRGPMVCQEPLCAWTRSSSRAPTPHRIVPQGRSTTCATPRNTSPQQFYRADPRANVPVMATQVFPQWAFPLAPVTPKATKQSSSVIPLAPRGLPVTTFAQTQSFCPAAQMAGLVVSTRAASCSAVKVGEAIHRLGRQVATPQRRSPTRRKPQPVVQSRQLSPRCGVVSPQHASIGVTQVSPWQSGSYNPPIQRRRHLQLANAAAGGSAQIATGLKGKVASCGYVDSNVHQAQTPKEFILASAMTWASVSDARSRCSSRDFGPGSPTSAFPATPALGGVAVTSQ